MKFAYIRFDRLPLSLPLSLCLFSTVFLSLSKHLLCSCSHLEPNYFDAKIAYVYAGFE